MVPHGVDIRGFWVGFPQSNLSPPKLGRLVAPIIDLSTPKLKQLVLALSVSARALAMS